MAKKRIFTVGFSLPGDDFENVEFESNQTLLDSDIILFEPTLGNVSTESDYVSGGSKLFAGKPILTEHSSFRAKQQTEHWRSEIIAAVTAGKLVIIYLAAPIERYRYTGEKNYSGTGKSRVASPVVAAISSYDAVPNLRTVSAKSGTSIKLDKSATYLAPYWREFSAYSPYEVEIDGDFSKVLLQSLAGNRTVGASFHGKSGVVLYLPPIRYDEDVFVRDAEEGEDDSENYWTEEALKFGKNFLAAIVSLANALKHSAQVTPPPTWSQTPEYRLARENELEVSILACDSEVAALQSKKANLEAELESVGSLRRLLYEQGKPLEDSLLEAMRLLGFDAQRFENGESEFDGVFVSSEGRCLGEAEGKDTKAVNIDKFSQLERNLQEDFAREDISEYAKGLLFGNAFRLTPIGERDTFFTDKCISAAKRVGAALICTPDLFAPCKYLKDNPQDGRYAKSCREAIFKASGTIVLFPPPPVNEPRIVTQDAELREVGTGTGNAN